MKVLIIPEDQTHDGFVAKPVVEAIFKDVHRTATVEVLPEPRLRGTSDTLNKEMVAQIVADNPMVDLFLLFVDRDCNRASNESKARERESEHPGKLIACVARQELEVWLLALHADWLDASWPSVRQECDPKERWAEPLLAQLGADGPGGGRKRAMRALSGRLKTLYTRCDEVAQLRDRLREFTAASRR